MKSLETLARRKAELLAISAVERQGLQLEAQMWHARFAALMRLGNVAAKIRANPLLTGGVVLSVMLIKPTRIARSLQKIHATWQTIRLFLPLIMPLLRRNQVK